MRAAPAAPARQSALSKRNWRSAADVPPLEGYAPPPEASWEARQAMARAVDGYAVPQELKRRRLLSSYGSNSSTDVPTSPSGSMISSSGEADPPDFWFLDMLDADSPVLFALQELKRYITDWNDLDSSRDPFWHRKSGQPVLSVVICRSEEKGGESFVAYRGMNTEVSLPCGSLCAERAAIARAASDFQHASRLLAIAVVDPSERINPLWPCEVCQSWLAKLRAQNPEISVAAVKTKACDEFLLRVNGQLLPPPCSFCLPDAVATPYPWQEFVQLADGTTELPWEAKDTVYVDGAWTFLHCAQQHILKVARSQGTHVLVGVHSDATVRQETAGTLPESFETRIGRILQNRNVSSVVTEAPWCVTQDLITSLGIRLVLTGSVSKAADLGLKRQVSNGSEGEPPAEAVDPYAVPRELGILEVVPSLDDTTEHSHHASFRHAIESEPAPP